MAVGAIVGLCHFECYKICFKFVSNVLGLTAEFAWITDSFGLKYGLKFR